jgi:hypothetical protein
MDAMYCVIFMRWEPIQPTFFSLENLWNQSANARIESEIDDEDRGYHAKALDKNRKFVFY